MKRKLIWKDYKHGFHMLWIWRLSLTWTNEFEYEKIIDLIIAKRGFMFTFYKYGIGLGHSFGLK